MKFRTCIQKFLGLMSLSGCHTTTGRTVWWWWRQMVSVHNPGGEFREEWGWFDWTNYHTNSEKKNKEKRQRECEETERMWKLMKHSSNICNLDIVGGILFLFLSSLSSWRFITLPLGSCEAMGCHRILQFPCSNGLGRQPAPWHSDIESKYIPHFLLNLCFCFQIRATFELVCLKPLQVQSKKRCS